ncbi:MAG TPA: Cof-type HAD-IIB family hydrolase [Pseudogracilibacillus sp.]|nr:Cof-type HAD-IIB family hydrolase [Pseudogracilibacillus sp.]
MFKIKEEIKLIAIDMDGTLLNTNNQVSSYTKKAITRAQNEGIKIVLSTGRPLSFCYDYHSELGLTTDLVTANGAQIWTSDKQLLTERTFESKFAEELWQYGDMNDYYMWMVATQEMFRNSSRPINFHEHKWIKLGFGRLNKEQKDSVFVKMLEYPELEVTSSSRSNIEVNDRHVNKASGLKVICDRLGITFDNMIAIGDSLNDKSMLEAAQIGVAMGNAIPEIKEVSNVITDTNDADGVAKIINHLLNEL